MPFALAMRLFGAVFLVVGLLFLVWQTGVSALMNQMGQLLFPNLAPTPLPQEQIWLSLSVSMMMTITVCCFLAAKDIHFALPVIVSKFVSTGCFSIFLLLTGQVGYLVGALTDGPIGVVILWLYLHERKKLHPAIANT